MDFSSHPTSYLQTWHQNKEDPPLRPGHEEDQRPEHAHQEQDLPTGFQLSSFRLAFIYAHFTKHKVKPEIL